MGGVNCGTPSGCIVSVWKYTSCKNRRARSSLALFAQRNGARLRMLKGEAGGRKGPSVRRLLSPLYRTSPRCHPAGLTAAEGHVCADFFRRGYLWKKARASSDRYCSGSVVHFAEPIGNAAPLLPVDKSIEPTRTNEGSYCEVFAADRSPPTRHLTRKH